MAASAVAGVLLELVLLQEQALELLLGHWPTFGVAAGAGLVIGGIIGGGIGAGLGTLVAALGRQSFKPKE